MPTREKPLPQHIHGNREVLLFPALDFLGTKMGWSSQGREKFLRDRSSNVLGCEQKSVEVDFRWPNLRVCNANYAAEQASDAKFW